MSDNIQVDVGDRVQTIRFDRAEKKNAITPEMYARITAALAHADRSDEIAVSVFLGQPGVFTAGNDLKDFVSVAMGAEPLTDVVDFLHAIINGQKPLVAAVDGIAVGVGTTMLMHCDLVYASPGATFQAPFVDLGLVPEAASSLVGPRIMGYQRAFELLVAGKTFSADDAFNSGLVNAVIPSEDLEAHALNEAVNLAAKPSGALVASRRLLRGDRDEIRARLDKELAEFFERLRSQEARDAFLAFMSRGKKAAKPS